jgi:cobyrinic acid a,c-diamide synthase
MAALRGGAGKTILASGIIAALVKNGKTVAPFKKGPDYIDAGWLSLAAGRPCYNLDTYLISNERILHSFLSRATDCELAVIEGNRGLYDGIDLEGTTSTAELAKLLDAPVLLCVDCTKSTRTMAAVIGGCLRFDPAVAIRGVILNQVAGARHERILRRSIEHYCGLPVLGAVPKLPKQSFPERHMGLVPTAEHAWARESVGVISEVADRYLDLDAIFEVGQRAPALNRSAGVFSPSPQKGAKSLAGSVRVGVVRDSAFQFYYPENLEALSAAGAEIVQLSPLSDATLPALDALYIGGGFPETHVERLAQNTSFSRELKTRAEDGLPIYAECGGLMYLGRELILDGKPYPMADVLPLVCGFYDRPQGHGYTVVSVTGENPYYAVGTEIKGHEFHYSRVIRWEGDPDHLVFRMKRGTGIIEDKDGICYRNVLATYTHVHALGTPAWAEAILRNARAYRQSNR